MGQSREGRGSFVESQNSPSTKFLFFFTYLLLCSTRPALLLLFCGGKISIKTLWIKINLNFRQKYRAVINIRSREVGFKLGESRRDERRDKVKTDKLAAGDWVVGTQAHRVQPDHPEKPLLAHFQEATPRSSVFFAPFVICWDESKVALPSSPARRHHLIGREVINTPKGEVSRKGADGIN